MFRLSVLVLVMYGIQPVGICAQNPLRFGSGVFAGINMAQIDGDDMQGFDKPGNNFGLKGIAYILPSFEFHTELSYSERGSQSKGYAKDEFRGRQMILNYGSITGLFTLNDWFDPIKEYFRLQWQGGVSYGHLIKYDTHDPIVGDGRKVNFAEVAPYFNTNDLTMVLGANLKLTDHIGISFRYNRSMNKVIDADQIQVYFTKRTITSMQGYFISFNAFYLF